MTKFNKRGVRPQTYSPVRSNRTPTGITYEGAAGYERDPRSELFLLAASNFMDTDTFYESLNDRNNRLLSLVRQVTVYDPQWVLGLVRWLRQEGNMRTVALVLGLEAAKALLDTGDQDFLNLNRKVYTAKFNKAQFEKGAGLNPKYGPGAVRLLVQAGIARADEPGEALAYWVSRYDRNVPMPVKRGIADAARKLYNQRSLLKYDTGSHGFRFADVINLTHPRPGTPEQASLFKHALDRRYGAADDLSVNLDIIAQNMWMRANVASEPNPVVLLNTYQLRRAGMTWEDALSLAGNKLDKKQLWEAMIPNMGYMALLRNLRNFDQAGVSDEVAQQVIKKLTDPNEVFLSRQLPFRFLSAYLNAPSLRWAWPLEQALNLSLSNVPSLPGKNLILVDTSSSMDGRFSANSKLNHMQAAALFGIAFASRAEKATLVSFSQQTKRFDLQRGESVLAAWKRWEQDYFLRGGTYTARALHSYFNDPDRVVIITDEQASRDAQTGEVDRVIPANVPVHTINLVGYKMGMAPSGQDNRHVFGGLSDRMFSLIPLVERGVNADWPWVDNTPS